MKSTPRELASVSAVDFARVPAPGLTPACANSHTGWAVAMLVIAFIGLLGWLVNVGGRPAHELLLLAAPGPFGVGLIVWGIRNWPPPAFCVVMQGTGFGRVNVTRPVLKHQDDEVWRAIRQAQEGR
jgi:hypothetical protein